MSRTVPFKKQRTCAKSVWVSVVLAALFMTAFFLRSSCGPLCGTTVQAADVQIVSIEKNSCCSSCHPAEETDPKGCCSDAISCSLSHLADAAIPLSPSTTRPKTPALLSFHAGQPFLPVRNEPLPATVAKTATGPPLHLRLEILRI